MTTRVPAFLLAALLALVVFAAGPALANSISEYSLDVEVVSGSKFGLNPGDLLLDAGRMRIDQSALTGIGTEHASVVDFSLTLGTEYFGFQPGPVITNVPGWGSFPTQNVAVFTDGVLSLVSLASISQNGHILALGWRSTTGTLGNLSLMADNYYVGEVRGTYSVNSVPEPTAGLLYAVGLAMTLGVLRRR